MANFYADNVIYVIYDYTYSYCSLSLIVPWKEGKYSTTSIEISNINSHIYLIRSRYIYYLNPLNTEFLLNIVIYTNPVRTSQETLRFRYKAQPVNAV
jgi:hypothetical protein